MALVAIENVLGREAGAPIHVRARTLDRALRKADVIRYSNGRVQRPRPFVAFVEGRPVLERQWAKTRTRPSDVVTVRYLPQGGGASSGNSGKSIGAAIAAIALAVTAPIVGGALSAALFGGSTLATGIIGSLYVAGGAYLINKLIAPRAKPTQAPQYGVAGGGNLPRSLDRIPVVYGQTWHTPDLSQPDFIAYNGGVQTLYKRMTIGAGDYQPNQIRIGNTILWDSVNGTSAAFPGCQVEWISPGNTSSLVPFNVITSPDVAGIQLDSLYQSFAGPFAACPSGSQITSIFVDYSFPRGAQTQDNHGHINGIWTWLDIEYQQIDDHGGVLGGWQSLFSSPIPINTPSVVRFTSSTNVPAGRYQVRMRQASPIPPNANGSGVVSWDQLRGTLPDPAVRPNVLELAMVVEANAGLEITSFSNVEVNVTKKVRTWNNGVWSAPTPTRNPVWAALDVLTNPVYGGAVADSRIDLNTFHSYATLFDSRADTFDAIIRGPVSILDAMETILRAVRSQPINLGSLWTMVRDEATTVTKFLFTGRQIKRGSTNVNFVVAPAEGAGDVILRWYQNGDPKQLNQIRATYAAPSISPKIVELVGVTNYNHAWREAQYLAAADVYRRQSIAFRTETDGRIVRRGDPCRVDVAFQSYTASRGVVANSGNTFTIDGDYTVASGDEIYIRDRHGREWGPVGITQGGNVRTIVLNSADVIAVTGQFGYDYSGFMVFDSGDLPTVRIGQPTYNTQYCRIVSARPTSLNEVEINVIVDSDYVHAADGTTIPPQFIPPSRGTVPSTLQLLYWSAVPVQNGNVLEIHWAFPPVEGASTYVVDITYDGGVTRSTLSASGALTGIHPIRPSACVLYARAYDSSGKASNEIAYSINASNPILYADKLVAPDAVPWETVSKVFQQLLEIPQVPTVNFDSDLALDHAAQVLSELHSKDSLRASANNVSAQFTQQINAAVSATGAVATRTTTLEATVNNPTTGLVRTRADLITEEGVRASADSALAARTSTLEATVNDPSTGVVATSGKLVIEQQVRAAADSALASQITTLNATVNDPNTGLAKTRADLIVEEQTRANADSALAQRATSLEVEVAAARGGLPSLQAKINAVETASVQGDNVIAGEVSQVSAQSAYGTANGQVGWAAVSGPSGTYAAFRVQMQAGGVTSGLMVAASAAGGSEVVIASDRLRSMSEAGGQPIWQLTYNGSFQIYDNT